MQPQQPYRISFDAQRRLLRLEHHGFWTVETLAGFAEALRAPIATALRLFPDFALLTDSRGMPVQPVPVMDGLNRLSMRAAREGRPHAILVHRTMNKLQAERYLRDPLIRVFFEEEPALAWLAEPREASILCSA